MKDIDDMKIGESFYLKRTVAVISTRTGKPCEFDEERIDVNALIIEELEKIKDEIGNEFVDLQDGSEEWRSYVNDAVLSCYEIVEKHIKELKGEKK